MGLGRGLFLGLLVGAIGAVAARVASEDQDEDSPWHEAREAARAGKQGTEAELQRRLDEARRTGHLPSDE